MSVLSGVGSVLSGMAGLFSLNGKQQDKVFSQNKELARIENQYNLNQWNRENAYNHPSAQRQRLRDAGLNPDLVYQNGVENLSSNSPELSAGSPMEMFDRSSEVREGVLSSANAILTGSQAVGQGLDNSAKEIDLLALSEKRKFELEEQKSKAKSAAAKARIDEVQADIDESTRDAKKNKAESESLIAAEQLSQEQLKTDILKMDKDVRKDMNDAQLSSIYTSAFKSLIDAGLSAQQSKILMQNLVINSPREGLAKSDKVMQDWLRSYLGDKGISVAYGLKDMVTPLVAVAKLFMMKGK